MEALRAEETKSVCSTRCESEPHASDLSAWLVLPALSRTAPHCLCITYLHTATPDKTLMCRFNDTNSLRLLFRSRPFVCKKYPAPIPVSFCPKFLFGYLAFLTRFESWGMGSVKICLFAFSTLLYVVRQIVRGQRGLAAPHHLLAPSTRERGNRYSFFLSFFRFGILLYIIITSHTVAAAVKTSALLPVSRDS